MDVYGSSELRLHAQTAEGNTNCYRCFFGYACLVADLGFLEGGWLREPD